MKKILFLLSALTLIVTLLFIHCQPAEISSAKSYLNDNKLDMALEQANLAVEKYPDNATAYFILGKVYAEKKDYDKMAEAFDKSLEISKEHAREIDEIKEVHWFTAFKDGIDNFKNNNMEAAAQNFMDAVKLKPDDINAYKNLALAYSNLGENEKAVSSLKTAVDIKPDDIDLKKTLGIAYYQAHQFEKAIETFQQVAESTQSDTSNTDTYALAIQHIAFSYDQLGKSEKAIEAYQKALEVFPGNTDLIYNLGRLYYMQENYEKAIEKFKEIADADPTDYDAVYNTAMSYLRAGKNEEAIPYFQKAIEIRPESFDAWNNLGVVYVRANMPEKGKAAFDKADEIKAANNPKQTQE